MPTSFNETIIEEFRANGGKVGGPFEGGDLLLLTTTGARSGTERTTPLGYVRHGELILLIGSGLGAPSHPGWYHNLLAHPVVRVEIGTSTFQALAVPAEGDRRDELFAHAVRRAPGYGDYQARTERVLPVVVLERADPDGWVPGEVRTLADKVMEVHTWLRGQVRQVAAEADAHFAGRADPRGPGGPCGPEPRAADQAALPGLLPGPGVPPHQRGRAPVPRHRAVPPRSGEHLRPAGRRTPRRRPDPGGARGVAHAASRSRNLFVSGPSWRGCRRS